MTSRVASMGPALAWDEEDSDCSACAPAAGGGERGAPLRPAWRPGAGLRGTAAHARRFRRAAPPAAPLGAGFWVPELAQRALSDRVASNAEWQELVSLLKIAGLAATPAVEVGAALRAKTRGSAAYEKFVDAVLGACQSPRAAMLGVTRYAIDESRGIENPRRTTVVLTVWFSDRDFGARMDAWREMRSIVDGYIVPLRDGAGGEMRDIDSRFFISLGRRNV